MFPKNDSEFTDIRIFVVVVVVVDREREMRLAARNEALQTATEQLQLKIQQKVRSNTGFLFVHGTKRDFHIYCKLLMIIMVY